MKPKVAIKSHAKLSIGKAVFAITEIQKGKKVIESHLLKTVSQRNKYSLEYHGRHVIIDEPGMLVNHSCDPNCILVPNQYGAFDFIACRQIRPNEEITFDYESIESEIVAFSDCHCGTKNCRKRMNVNQKRKHYDNDSSARQIS